MAQQQIRFSFVISSALVFLALTAPGAQATSMTTVSVSGDNCTLSQSSTGTFSTSQSISCSGGAAQAGASFDISSPTLASFQYSATASPFTISNTAGTLTYGLYVTGGVGPGVLQLSYFNNSGGFSDGQASASATLMVLDGASTLYNSRVCQNIIATTSPFGCSGTIPIAVPFTFGTPFTLSLSLTSVAGGGLGGSDISGTGTFTYAIQSAAGQTIPGASLSLVPEPSAVLPLTFGLITVLISRMRRKAAAR